MVGKQACDHRHRVGRDAFTVICALAFLFAVGGQAALAQQAGGGSPLTDAEAEQINDDYSSPRASEQVQAAIEEYYRKKGVSQGVTGPKGQVYYHAVERVTADPSSSAWVKSRAIAFDKAMLELQKNFVFDNWGDTVTATESELFQDDSNNARDFAEEDITKSRIGAMWDKVVALGDAFLDKWLRDLDVDPEQFHAVPPEQRKDLFLSRYINKTLNEATGRSAGLIVMKTFEGQDDKNNHVIGVVAKFSPALGQLASNIAYGTEPFLTTKVGKYEPIGEFIMGQTPEQLSTTFGIRLRFDEQGQVVVLSHGMWGFGYKGDDERRRDRAEQGAARQAASAANSALAKFVNGRLKYAEESEYGEIEEHFLTKRGDDITEQDVASVIDRLSSEISLDARADMRGVRTVRQWTYDHPYGHTIKGVIRAWRIDFAEQANEVRNFKPQRGQARVEDEEEKESGPDVEPGVSSSDAYDDMDEDF